MEEGTQDTTTVEESGQAEAVQTPADQGGWYNTLSDPDLKNNPTLQKYGTAEEAHKGHLALQASFGMDKVAWPKDENDTERWAEVNKRLGVPGTPEGYNLEAIASPGEAQLFDRVAFQQMMKDVDAPASVATKLWASYTGRMKAGYSEAQEAFQANVDSAKADLMAEWGDAYESNINRGQQVIDTLADSQEQKDFLTATLAQDPNGSRFLAKIGAQYVESSIGGFQEKQNFTMTPDEARQEIDRIKASPDYHSNDDRIRMPLVDRTNDLMRMAKPMGL